MLPSVHLRILHIITRLDLGGSSENTLLTALGLASRGHSVTIICGFSDNPASATEQAAILQGVSIIRLRNLNREISLVGYAAAVFAIYRHMRGNRYDIVHTHTSKAGVVGRIAAFLAGLRGVVHTPHGHVFYGYFSRPLTRIFIAIEQLAARVTKMHITFTEAEKNDYAAHHIGSPGKFVSIYSGIELDRFLRSTGSRDAVRKEMGCRPSDFLVGTVARLVPVKNHALIVDAAAITARTIPDCRFVFVGGGELEATLKARVKVLGLETRVIFCGWRSDIPSVLRAFDLFAMVSLNEGMGRAFVEAQAAGLPVIGSAVGGIPEVLDPGKTGWLVPPDDPAALAAAIKKLYDRRAELPALADQCRAWACSRFGVDTMVDKIEHVYRGVLGQT